MIGSVMKKIITLSSILLCCSLLSACQGNQSPASKALGSYPPEGYSSMTSQQQYQVNETYINTFFAIAAPNKNQQQDYHEAMMANSQLQNKLYTQNQATLNSEQCSNAYLPPYPSKSYKTLTTTEKTSYNRNYINLFMKIEMPTKQQETWYKEAQTNLDQAENAQY